MHSNITNQIVLSYVDSLYESNSEQLNNLRIFAEEQKVPIILKDTEGLLRILMKLRKPVRVLEIGTAVGYSACVFASECDCSVTTIEASGEMADTAESNIRELGFDSKVSVLRGDGRDVLDSLIEENCPGFDFVFIDAAKSHYKAFWDKSVKLLNAGGVIVCDNVLMKGMTAHDSFDTKGRYKTSIRKMREFIRYINSQENVETCILPVGDGVSISLF